MWKYRVLSKTLGETDEVAILDLLFQCECTLTYKYIANELNMTVQKVSSIARHLKRFGMVIIEKTEHGMAVALKKCDIVMAINNVRVQHILFEHKKMSKYLERMGIPDSEWLKEEVD